MSMPLMMRGLTPCDQLAYEFFNAHMRNQHAINATDGQPIQQPTDTAQLQQSQNPHSDISQAIGSHLNHPSVPEYPTRRLVHPETSACLGASRMSTLQMAHIGHQPPPPPPLPPPLNNKQQQQQQPQLTPVYTKYMPYMGVAPMSHQVNLPTYCVPNQLHSNAYGAIHHQHPHQVQHPTQYQLQHLQLQQQQQQRLKCSNYTTSSPTSLELQQQDIWDLYNRTHMPHLTSNHQPSVNKQQITPIYVPYMPYLGVAPIPHPVHGPAYCIPSQLYSVYGSVPAPQQQQRLKCLSNSIQSPAILEHFQQQADLNLRRIVRKTEAEHQQHNRQQIPLQRQTSFRLETQDGSSAHPIVCSANNSPQLSQQVANAHSPGICGDMLTVVATQNTQQQHQQQVASLKIVSTNNRPENAQQSLLLLNPSLENSAQLLTQTKDTEFGDCSKAQSAFHKVQSNKRAYCLSPPPPSNKRLESPYSADYGKHDSSTKKAENQAEQQGTNLLDRLNERLKSKGQQQVEGTISRNKVSLASTESIQSVQPRSQQHQTSSDLSHQTNHTSASPTVNYKMLKCLICLERLEFKHFVQCPSVPAHKFCFACSRDSILKQRMAIRELKSDETEKIYCPSGKRCLLANERSPWTFMTNEIETIYRETVDKSPIQHQLRNKVNETQLNEQTKEKSVPGSQQVTNDPTEQAANSDKLISKKVSQLKTPVLAVTISNSSSITRNKPSQSQPQSQPQPQLKQFQQLQQPQQPQPQLQPQPQPQPHPQTQQHPQPQPQHQQKQQQPQQPPTLQSIGNF